MRRKALIWGGLRVTAGARREGGARIELELPGFTASSSREQSAELARPALR
jgi:hypothetical protein